MITWISSYPKSGNTWVRAFITTYLYSNNENFTINLLNKINEFPDHTILGKLMDGKDFHNLAKISENWIKVQEFINLNNKRTFLKTHNALCNINGNMFANNDTTAACIYIVRDPRNVVLSMSNHFGLSQEESFKNIINEKYIVYPTMKNQTVPCTLVSSWNQHYLSWKNSNLINKIIIKYEDLIEDPEATFKKIISFLNKHTNLEIIEEKFQNAIKITRFDNLKKFEEEHGFNMGQKDKFFHLGKKNNWKSLLDPQIESRIRAKFEPEMKELGYT